LSGRHTTQAFVLAQGKKHKAKGLFIRYQVSMFCSKLKASFQHLLIGGRQTTQAFVLAQGKSIRQKACSSDIRFQCVAQSLSKFSAFCYREDTQRKLSAFCFLKIFPFTLISSFPPDWILRLSKFVSQW
jgi:hypothetical protein